MFETLASGFGLVEGPTADDRGGLFFSDVLKGGVYRLDASGVLETVVRVMSMPPSYLAGHAETLIS